MTPLFDAPLAIVDLETTGAHPDHARVTEIAVVEVEDGDIVAEWSTLVNPGVRIPAGIQALTGITDAMVADAPAFEDLAGGLYERLAGRIFVAHNVRFDYGFLRREFQRSGIRFSARTLCTVKLSRRLYPEHPRHGLDNLIARHGLHCAARHRAMGDAQAVWQFLRIAAEERGVERLQDTARQLSKLPALPAHIDRAVVDAIPESHGVYLFYGEGDALLYVGKSNNLRERVLQHFSGDLRSAREMRLGRELRRIEWRATCGELGALLLEARLVKDLLPAYNRKLRPQTGDEPCGFAFIAGKLSVVSGREINAETLPLVCGAFRSRRAALASLRKLADEHHLCLQAMGFAHLDSGPRKGACFRHQVGRCAGVCAAKEGVHLHQARVAAALASFKSPAWPWRGPVAVVEENHEREAVDVHVVHRWCLLGTVRSEGEVAELLHSALRAPFDLDQYQILSRHLRGRRRARILELPALAN